jgi:hypothetical protein
MRIVVTVLGGFFLFAALYVAVMNWACAIISLRNQRKGIDKHHSMIPVVTLLLAFFAMVMFPYWPGKWTMLIPVLDIANLNLLFAPVYLIIYLLRKRGDKTRS